MIWKPSFWAAVTRRSSKHTTSRLPGRPSAATKAAASCNESPARRSWTRRNRLERQTNGPPRDRRRARPGQALEAAERLRSFPGATEGPSFRAALLPTYIPPPLPTRPQRSFSSSNSASNHGVVSSATSSGTRAELSQNLTARPSSHPAMLSRCSPPPGLSDESNGIPRTSLKSGPYAEFPGVPSSLHAPREWDYPP